MASCDSHIGIVFIPVAWVAGRDGAIPATQSIDYLSARQLDVHE